MATIANPNFNKKDEEQKEQAQKPQMLSGGASAPAPASAPASQGQQAKPASSGGFTNLSNYLSANKQAGSQIAGQVQKGIEKDLSQKKESANTEAEQFKNAVDASKSNIQQGQQFLNQITPQQQAQGAAPALNDYTGIANNADTLKQFTGLREGTTQAEAAAKQNQEQTEAVNAATDVAKTYGKRIGEIQSNDRFGLLKEFLANPKQQYGRGVSSLDNAFLQRDKSKALQGLNQNLQRESVLDTKQRADTLEQMGTQAADVTQQGKDVASNLKKQAQANLESTSEYAKNVNDINSARKAEQDWANAQYDKLKKGEAIDQRFADMLGLSQGQRIGDILARGNVTDYLGFGPTEVTSRLQALSPEESAKMNAIYQLAGQTFEQPEQIAAALQQNAQFDPSKLQGSYNQMIQNYLNLDPSSPLGAAAAQAGIDSLGNLINERSSIENLINTTQIPWSEERMQDPKYRQDYQTLLNLQRAVGGVTGVTQSNSATRDYLTTLLNNLANQGYYNTVSIANPNKTVNNDLPTRIPGVNR